MAYRDGNFRRGERHQSGEAYSQRFDIGVGLLEQRSFRDGSIVSVIPQKLYALCSEAVSEPLL